MARLSKDQKRVYHTMRLNELAEKGEKRTYIAPERGFPIAGTGKHHGDSGQGESTCTIRLKCGTRLIGTKQPKGVHDMESEHRDLVLRKMTLSEADDSTIQEWEAEIDRQFREEHQVTIEELVAISKKKTINDVPEPAVAYICADDVNDKDEDDCEDDDNSSDGKSFEQFDEHDEDEDAEDRNGGIHFNADLFSQDGLQFRMFDPKLNRVVTDRSSNWKVPKIEDLEDRRFEDPFGFAMGEHMPWHNQGGFVPVVFD